MVFVFILQKVGSELDMIFDFMRSRIGKQGEDEASNRGNSPLTSQCQVKPVY